MEFLPRIEQATGAVLNVSTGGGLSMSRQERLRGLLRASPGMASMNMGSMNFGIFPMLARHSKWRHAWESEFLETARDFIVPSSPFAKRGVRGWGSRAKS